MKPAPTLSTAPAEGGMLPWESPERFSAALENIPDFILFLDREGRIRYINKVVPGVNRADVIGRSVYDPEYLPSSSRERVRSALDRVLSGGPTEEYEVEGLGADGHHTSYYCRLTPFIEDGSITGCVYVATDVAALRESEERFRKIFEASPFLLTISRLSDGRFLAVNDRFVEASGWSRGEAVGRNGLELGLWASVAEREELFAQLRQGGSVRGVAIRFKSRAGEERHVQTTAEILRVGGEECVLVAAQDVTDRREAELLMSKLSRAVEQTADAVMITDPAGRIEYVNPAFCATTGFTAEEVRGRQPSILKSGSQDAAFYRSLWQTIRGGRVWNDVFVNRRKDGSLYYEEKTITPLKDSAGAITHFISSGRDITERVQTQERLQYLSSHDALTGLANRALLLDRLRMAVARARRRERCVAVLLLDLDRFKTINDTLGHDVGDRLLKVVADRVRGVVRDGDTVARFGGDEFVVLLDDLDGSAAAGAVGLQILDAIRPPISDEALHLTASLGISLFPADGDEPGDLLKHADAAMYRAKDLGRDGCQFYSTELSAHALQQLTLERELRRALARGELVVHYQPQVDARTGRVVAVEALLRWQHPVRGLVLPAEFVPVLEETGLIVPAGRALLATAVRDLAAWDLLGHHELRVAVNVSGRELVDPGFVDFVGGLLADQRVAPVRLELELTENIIMSHASGIVATLQALCARGLRLALDDFGTGYSSLSHLRRLPIHSLKIDRSFVAELPNSSDDLAITRAIVGLASSLRLDLVAEGVETPGQCALLRGLGCDVMQGWLFAHAEPAAQITERLAAIQPPTQD